MPWFGVSLYDSAIPRKAADQNRHQHLLGILQDVKERIKVDLPDPEGPQITIIFAFKNI